MKMVLKSFLTLILSLSLFSCGSKKAETAPETVVEKPAEIKTVQIGNQIWTAENLNVIADSGCWVYNDEEANSAIYGRLYDWETAQKLCPEGWRLPTQEDWITLYKNYGAYDIAAPKMKSAKLWNTPDSGNPEATSLNVLPGGMRNSEGSFFALKSGAFFWTATERGADHAMYIELEDGKSEVIEDAKNKKYAFSVRYIKN